MSDVIMEKVIEFERRCGIYPNAVYLGYEEYIKLKKELRAWSLDMKLRVGPCVAYCVDADHHLGIGIV